MVYLHLAVIVKYIGIEYSLVSRFKLTLSVDLIASQLVDGWFGSSLQFTRLLAVTATLLMIYFE